MEKINNQYFFKTYFWIRTQQKAFFLKHWEWKKWRTFPNTKWTQIFLHGLTKRTTFETLIWFEYGNRPYALVTVCNQRFYIECPHWYVLQSILHKFLIIITYDSWIWFRLSFFLYILSHWAKSYSNVYYFCHLQTLWAKHLIFCWNTNQG